jgi:hypothetical protein
MFSLKNKTKKLSSKPNHDVKLRYHRLPKQTFFSPKMLMSRTLTAFANLFSLGIEDVEKLLEYQVTKFQMLRERDREKSKGYHL